jgi:hypothetical protein
LAAFLACLAAVARSEGVKDLTMDNFEQETATGLWLIDFYAVRH